MLVSLVHINSRVPEKRGRDFTVATSGGTLQWRLNVLPLFTSIPACLPEKNTTTLRRIFSASEVKGSHTV